MKITDAEVMKVHEELIVLDGTAALLTWGLTPKGKVQDPSGPGFDYYIPGVFTGGAASHFRIASEHGRSSNGCVLL